MAHRLLRNPRALEGADPTILVPQARLMQVDGTGLLSARAALALPLRTASRGSSHMGDTHRTALLNKLLLHGERTAYQSVHQSICENRTTQVYHSTRRLRVS
jgi:hypothetical protein